MDTSNPPGDTSALMTYRGDLLRHAGVPVSVAGDNVIARVPGRGAAPRCRTRGRCRCT
ncbi:hypothetical protein [Cryptosporangium japonicum]|uniref:hypothetical protein n=1 Tax=Cryptosporangium japonicum TaxID=80872 RepID=UPI0031D83375